MESAINELYEKADECYGYKIGDQIQVNGIDFYVIADSPATQDYVVALKAEPLTVSQVNTYGGVGTANNHVNKYDAYTVGHAYNKNGYGALSYYSSESCGLVNGEIVNTGCITDYDESDIKFIVDAWANDVLNNTNLKVVDGYSVRLIKDIELETFGYGFIGNGVVNVNATVPTWVYDSQYAYWTMTPYPNHKFNVRVVRNQGTTQYHAVYRSYNSDTVRPVINVYKSAIESKN